MSPNEGYNILADDLGSLSTGDSVFVALGEVMLRETPADMERPERTRLVHLSWAGSEFTLAVALSRFGVSSSFVTRAPDNPYGRALRNTARENGVNTDYLVWAPKKELIGRLVYEIGRTPRRDIATYQRMQSAASRLDAGMVDWRAVLAGAKLFHTSGITLGLASHSGYDRNYSLAAFNEALAAKPASCLVGLDFNYRSTLWSRAEARDVLTPVITEGVDILVTTIEDMAQIYGIGCGGQPAEAIVKGEIPVFSDDDLRCFLSELLNRFGLRFAAITVRYPDSFEQHRWESAASDRCGNFYRSPAVRSITLLDRLGGGDTWNAGFYYGLLTAGAHGRRHPEGDPGRRCRDPIEADLDV